MMYPLLHETLNVGSLVLKNRLVLPPMATEKSAKGQVTDGLVAYYGDMARSGPDLIIQEHSFVSPEGRASANQVSLAADADIPGLQRLTAAVHAQGVPILAQISHAGSAAHRAITGQEVISASAVSNPSRAASVQGQPEFPREMTQGISSASSRPLSTPLSGHSRPATTAWKSTRPMAICWTSSIHR
ncbi:oxidoreductase [Megasphaera sp.]|uniref:oxidoreductase n=1 Tax=Megasphaera sp. TaxID=2023260 RepID=UPI004027962D